MINSIIDSGLRTNYGLLKYNGGNIGDNIQSLAGLRFLPHVDYYVFRERISDFRSNSHEKVKMILNAWYIHSPKYFPPSEDIDPFCCQCTLRKVYEEK